LNSYTPAPSQEEWCPFIPTPRRCEIRRIRRMPGPENRLLFILIVLSLRPLKFRRQIAYSSFLMSNQIAPFGVNPMQWAFSEKGCKSVAVFAYHIEKDPPGNVIRARNNDGLSCGNAGSVTRFLSTFPT